MINFLQTTGDLANILGFAVLSAFVAFAWAPLLTKFLYRYHMSKGAKAELAGMAHREGKEKAPVMGGLLIIVTVAVLTWAFDWNRSFTWVPVGVMLFSAFLG